MIGRGLRELRIDVRGKRVLLKPNLVEYEPGTVINTHPHVVVGAAVALRRAGAREVVVAEGPGHRRDLEYLLSSTGLLPLLTSEKVPFVDLNHDDVRASAAAELVHGAAGAGAARGSCSTPTSSCRCPS